MIGMNKFVNYINNYINNTLMSHTTTFLDNLGNCSLFKIYLPFI